MPSRPLLPLFTLLLGIALGWPGSAQAQRVRGKAKAPAASHSTKAKAKAKSSKSQGSSKRPAATARKATTSLKLGGKGTPRFQALTLAPSGNKRSLGPSATSKLSSSRTPTTAKSGRSRRLKQGKDVAGGTRTSLLHKVNGGAYLYRGKLIIDVGGEGRHKGAVNLNPGELTSTTGAPGRKIPNLIQGVGEKMPFKSGIADTLIVESAPIRPGTAAELARVIKSKGTIKLSHPSDYAQAAHASVIDAVGGKVTQSTKNGVTSTLIVAP